MPTAVRASRTSSSLNGLMMAITIFMAWSLFPSAGDPRHAESDESCRTGRHGRRHRPRREQSRSVPSRRGQPGIPADQRVRLGFLPILRRGEAMRLEFGHNTLVGGRRPEPDQAFLRHGGDQPAVAAEQAATVEATAAGRRRTVLGIEQPLVRTEWPMEPQRVVEARHLEVTVEDRTTMIEERGDEQRNVGGVGEHETMVVWIV